MPQAQFVLERTGSLSEHIRVLLPEVVRGMEQLLWITGCYRVISI